ncbi:hypothetical protein M3M33_17415, partial [Loigolactobacillus coryniformis]|uniref:hypothetical protein n=1 Tax=Loigolactobacillus coryniformis TaxID=1610 RepID=UPI00201A6A6D
ILAFLPNKPKPNGPALAMPFGPSRSMRDIEVEEDLQAVGEAFRESERIARQKAAIDKIAQLAVTTTKAK